MAYNSLARAYESIDDQKNALQTYQKAEKLATKLLSSNIGYFTRQLERIEKKLEN